MAAVIFSNVGGTCTPIGDPPNVIIASNSKILKGVRTVFKNTYKKFAGFVKRRLRFLYYRGCANFIFYIII